MKIKETEEKLLMTIPPFKKVCQGESVETGYGLIPAIPMVG
jgi:hypothetical protein